jgi:ketosteroid isomerase-like protein
VTLDRQRRASTQKEQESASGDAAYSRILRLLSRSRKEMNMKRTVWALGGLALLAGAGLFPTATAAPEAAKGCAATSEVTPGLRDEILKAREAVWRAWFANDRQTLDAVIPEETVAINAGDGPWEGRAEVLAGAEKFAASGAKLMRLEYPRTEIRLYGDVAILYTTYLFEVISPDGKRETTAGRGTEIFVRRDGRWVNPGWHLDSGK